MGERSRAADRSLLRGAWALVLLLVLALGCGCAPAGAESAPPASSAAPAAQQQDQIPEALRHVEPREVTATTRIQGVTASADTVDAVGPYTGEPGVYINGNMPAFTDAELESPLGTERYGQLDRLGRCTEAFALVGPETEPSQPRGSISAIHPSGWQQAAYPQLGLDHLYERSHLIAHCLTGEDANERNLITGTNYMNQGLMQVLEQKMDRYVDSTGNHLLLRVTPWFTGDELVARGVQMQAYSIEDEGRTLCFNIYLHNVQPGVDIDYATGASAAAAALAATGPAEAEPAAEAAEPAPASAPATQAYVLNTNTRKFHHPGCASVARMKDENKQCWDATRDEVIAAGYTPCGNCHP